MDWSTIDRLYEGVWKDEVIRRWAEVVSMVEYWLVLLWVRVVEVWGEEMFLESRGGAAWWVFEK